MTNRIILYESLRIRRLFLQCVPKTRTKLFVAEFLVRPFLGILAHARRPHRILEQRDQGRTNLERVHGVHQQSVFT